jgi:tRNA threonylcarbamoyladenosine biosynthesis protein TsaE
MSGRRIVVRTADPAETRAAGRAIGRSLPAGFALSLEGPLGAGKTVLASGVCEGLGVEGPVTSPTFTLQNEYRARGGRLVVHVDCFRLGGPDELEDLGVMDRLEEDSVLLVEWGDRARAALPPDAIRVELQPGPENERRIVIHLPDGVRLGALGPDGGGDPGGGAGPEDDA